MHHQHIYELVQIFGNATIIDFLVTLMLLVLVVFRLRVVSSNHYNAQRIKDG